MVANRRRKTPSTLRSSYASVVTSPAANIDVAAAVPFFKPTLIADTMRSYSCILLAIIKNEEVPGSFSSSLDTLFAANNLPKVQLGDFQPPTIDALRNMGTLPAKDESPILPTTPLQAASSSDVPACQVYSRGLAKI